VTQGGQAVRPRPVPDDEASAPADDPPPPPDRFRTGLWGPLAGLLLAACGAAATSVVVQLLVDGLIVPRPSYVATALTALSAFVGAGLVAVVVLWEPRRLTAVAGVVLPAAISSAAQAFQLGGSRFYLFGTGGDQVFRLQYLGRFAASPALADGTFAALPSFYPPAWFWVGGRLAAWSGIPAWAVYKPYSVATMAVAAAVAFVLWSRVVRSAAALSLATLTAVVGLLVGAYEPYGWLVAVAVPPLGIIAWRLLSAEVGASGRRWWAPSVGLGLFVGLTAVTYTLFLGAFLLVLGIAAAAVVAGAGARDVETWVGRVRVVLVRLVPVALMGVTVAAPVWSPFLLAALTAPTAGNAAARYLPEAGATFGAPMFEASVLGALCLVGLVWTVLRLRSRATAQGLAVVVVACYAYYCLSTLALALGTTLLSFKLDFVLPLTLACAGVLAVPDLAELADRRLPGSRGRDVRLGAAVLGVLACVHLVQTPSATIAPLVEPAFTAYDDRGVSASDGTMVPRLEEPGTWNAELIAAIDVRTGRPPHDVVVLTSYGPLMDFRPYRGFQAGRQEYANPLALYPARNAEIERWSRSPDAAALPHALDSGPFRPPDVFVLTRTDAGLATTLAENVFPLAEGTREKDVVFAPQLFDAPGFHRADVGPFTVITRIRS
jgi:galactan 5-O-arabinofuranosyltransferase